MRIRQGAAWAVLTVLGTASLAAVAAAAGEEAPFQFSPVPRWSSGPTEEPETSQVCAAVRQECPGIKDVTDIQADFGYDALYDADGQLVGMRVTKSTGCKPLDEYLLLSQRKFRMVFHKPGQSDIDGGLRAELAPGTAKGAVRIVKPDGTSLSMGCNPS